MKDDFRLVDNKTLERIFDESRKEAVKGTPASYIPILAKADPNAFGVCLIDQEGNQLSCGDFDKRFSIQSIEKILAFTMALMDNPIEKIASKISVEPTSGGFNSISNLEMQNDNKPLNPMINAGAIACMMFVSGHSPEQKIERIVEFARKVAADPTLEVNHETYSSEKRTGHRNRALAYYMKSTGVIGNEFEVESLLDVYFSACSLYVTCENLARIALVYAMDGVDPITGQKMFPKRVAQIVKATMTMCGMYNESGQIAVRVGLPTKSGVGGGILSVVPGKLGIGLYGPALNSKGNSVAGLALLEKLSHEMNASIF
jgi:glutaminase